MNIDNDVKIICEFEEWLIADGKAAKTSESYVGDIRTFHQWLKFKGDIYIENLKRFHITSYRNYLGASSLCSQRPPGVMNKL